MEINKTYNENSLKINSGDFDLCRYVIEKEYIKRLNELKFWQFRKKKEAYEWRRQNLLKYTIKD